MHEPITYSIASAFDSDGVSREAFDRLAIETGAPVYMTYDWLRIWWQFYAAGGSLRLFTFRRAGEAVGLVPVYLRVIGMPPFRIRVARLVGANIPPKVFNPPIDPASSKDIWESVLRHLFVQDKCDVVSLGPLSETYRGFQGLQEAAHKGGSDWSAEPPVVRDVHTVYYLPKTLDELLASLDGKERKVRRKKLRDLEAKGPIRGDVVKEPAAVEHEFEEFARAHTSQWEAEGRPGHFHAWPRALEYNRELVRVHSRLGRVRFVRLFVGEQLVANQYNFAFGRGLYAELPSRVVGTEWDRLSLGCSSQVKLLETAIAEGFETMESGLGHYEYKVLLGGREHTAFILRLHARRAASRVRGRACSAGRDLLMLFSQKLWYKRLSPRLPKYLRSGQSELSLAHDY
jgi:CelD/BcsL family acetyltransferase involved in cellulose biosynthesis